MARGVVARLRMVYGRFTEGCVRGVGSTRRVDSSGLRYTSARTRQGEEGEGRMRRRQDAGARRLVICRGAAAPQQTRRSWVLVNSLGPGTLTLDLPPTTLAGWNERLHIVLSNGTVGKSPKYILGHARSTVFGRLAFARRLCSRRRVCVSRVTPSERGWVGARTANRSSPFPLLVVRGEARGRPDHGRRPRAWKTN
jgi:hypothetical protein